MVFHLTCLVYSQCWSKKFMVSPVGMDEVDTNLGNGDDEATETWGCSALHVAAADANLEEMRRVLPHMAAADVNAVDAWDETPLHMAVRRGSIAACDLLLEAKADVNARNANDETPLAVINAKANSENDLAQNSDFDLWLCLIFSSPTVLSLVTRHIRCPTQPCQGPAPQHCWSRCWRTRVAKILNADKRDNSVTRRA